MTQRNRSVNTQAKQEKQNNTFLKGGWFKRSLKQHHA